MARIRTIKPEFWRDESLASISPEACLLALGLLNHCDDEGYFNANPKLVESDIFPLRELKLKTTVLLQELCKIGYLLVFQGNDGKTYGCIKNFEKHQVINKKTPSKIKHLCEVQQDYRSDVVVLPTGKEGKGNGKEMEQGKKSAVAPRPEDVSQQVWDDWVALRKRKGTTISETAIEGAREEAAKIGWTLQQFLIEWCTRGSQGLKAEWIKPDEKQSQTETVYQRSMRLKMQEAVPSIAKQAPYQDASDFFRTIDMESQKAIEVNK
jgi:hypothetical protein